MIRVDDAHYRYPGRGTALCGVTATFPQGLTLVAGPNGGGKSTLLLVLSGLFVPDAGTVRGGNGEPLSAGRLRALSRLVMQEADPQLLGATVEEDVALGKPSSALAPERFAAESARLARLLGLDGLWSAPVDALSCGGKRKLCLLHALLAGPELLLLDEPFAALDYPASRELREFVIGQRDRGVSLVVSTHDLEPLFDVADWLVVLAEGKAVREGRPAELSGELAGLAVRPPGAFAGAED
ncbi:MAG: energy-coupling factor ABC transporter ATP-binding protein [Planctomycetota bacterium]|jgi:biotin transport system ATP-binding protein|nr:energy-coupling factor ABC transporter ATP-binding protein [Planctomycetota bacterium]